MSAAPAPEKRRTEPWLRLDAGMPDDALIVDLGTEHGPGGPYVYVTLLCAAKMANDGGELRMGWAQLAAKTYLADTTEARRIVAGLRDRALITLTVDEPLEFECVIVGWAHKQRPADPGAAKRKAAQRARDRGARDPGDKPPVTPEPPGDGVPVSGDVTAGHPDCHPTTVDRGQETTTASLPAAVGDVAGAGAGESIDFASPVLHPDLAEVLGILEAAPNVQVEPAAVESALRAFPGADGVRAAHEVASFAHEGGLNITASNRLLLAQLRKQTDRPQQQHAGRRHGQPPAPPAARPAEEAALFDRTRRELAEARTSTPPSTEATF